MGSFAVGVLPFALVLGVVAVLMLLEPHLSGTVLILCIGAVLMFVGGTGLRWFVWRGWAAQRPSVRPLPSCRTLCPMQPAA